MTFKLDNLHFSVRDGFESNGQQFDWVKITVIAKDEQLRCSPSIVFEVPVLADDTLTKAEIKAKAHSYAKELLDVAVAALDGVSPPKTERKRSIGSGLAAPEIISDPAADI